jgi:RNA polymerase sigma-70 factor, ECF subfamily
MLALSLAPVLQPRAAREECAAVKSESTGITRVGRTSGASAAASDLRDRGLIERIARQDRAALKELYLIYHRRLARFLTRITPRYDLAEEIINDTFWVVWQRAGDFRGASYVSTWIMGIAYRRGLKALKRGRVAQASAQCDVAEEGGASHEPWSAAERREWLSTGLERLPSDQRVVLELAYHLGHSCEEIAAIMNCPVNTVKTRMFHARQKLKVLLPALAGMQPQTRE